MPLWRCRDNRVRIPSRTTVTSTTPTASVLSLLLLAAIVATAAAIRCNPQWASRPRIGLALLVIRGHQHRAPTLFIGRRPSSSLSPTLARHRGRPHQTQRGNEAADADSIVSSICHAFYLHQTAAASSSSPPSSSSKGGSAAEAVVVYAAVLPIPRRELSLRTETVRLLDKVNIDKRDLLFLDEVDLPSLHSSSRLRLTLVDHNALRQDLLRQGLEDAVVEIVDHHEDKGLHLGVQDERRHVAFTRGQDEGQLGQPAVASACTLIAEQYLSCEGGSGGAGGGGGVGSLCPAVATLLLGVIMLDSAGLDPKAKKATDRDVAAVQGLEAKAGGGGVAKTLFDELSKAKFDPTWWRSLSVSDALKYDYKRFSVEREGGGVIVYGMSAVLTPLDELVRRPDFSSSALSFTQQQGQDIAAGGPLPVLILMSFVMEPSYERQLAVYGPPGVAMGGRLVEALLHDPRAADLAFQEELVTCPELEPTGASLRLFKQGNTVASRKQVEPVIRSILRNLK